MAVTSNTSPVVASAKMGRLSMLRELYDTVMVPASVKAECLDRGKELGATDVREIETAFREGWMKVVELDRKQQRSAAKLIAEAIIGLGEAEALILAKEKKSIDYT